MKLFYLLLIIALVSCKEVRLTPVPDGGCMTFQEECDGIDNDCDGVIDNPEAIGFKPCYDGGTEDLLYGVCRFGVERCADGVWECIGQVLPSKEKCNALDDDCDGEADEGLGTGVDIIFVIDYSGSMVGRISLVNQIITDWASTNSHRNSIKFALVGAPSSKSNKAGEVSLMLNLTDTATFISELGNQSSSGSLGLEPTLDAIYFLSLPTNPLGINWTAGNSRSIFLFTDEEPQSYATPLVRPEIARQTALDNKVNVFVFTTESTWRAWNSYPLASSSMLEEDINEAIALSVCDEK